MKLCALPVMASVAASPAFAAAIVFVACDGGGASDDHVVAAARADLGRLLFYDPILSADEETACATCHSELWGMSDGLARSIGQGAGSLAGPGRTGPNVLTRNAPTLWNVGLRKELFWDGREASLEAQVLLPLENPAELGRTPADAVAEIRAIPEYVTLFAAAFPELAEPVTEGTLVMAIAAFERTLVSEKGLWDAWMAGDDGALSAEMIRGYEVFGASGCGRCHVPPTFESNVFVRRRAIVDGGDVGRMAVTHRETDRGAFRTPSLRNARETGPYFHDGAVATLEDAVASELAFDGVALGESDRAALVQFLGRALVDRSHEPARPKSVPSGLSVPRDGFRIPR